MADPANASRFNGNDANWRTAQCATLDTCLKHLPDESIVEGTCRVQGQHRLHALRRAMKSTRELGVSSSSLNETHKDIVTVALADGMHI